MPHILLCILFIIFIILSILQPQKLTKAALDSAILWATKVFPSLFPFMFCTKSLLALNVRPIFELVLGIPLELIGLSKRGAYPFAVSLLCGYPSGSGILSSMHQDGSLTLDECQQLAPLCHTSGPIFIFGYASAITGINGIDLFTCHLCGVIASVCILSALRRAVSVKRKKVMLPQYAPDACTGTVKTNEQNAELRIGHLLSSSCLSSLRSCLTVGGFIVFFGSFCALFDAIDKHLLALFEMTNGLSFDISPSFCCFLLTFSGICIIFQALALLPQKIKPMKFIGCKLISGILSALFYALTQSYGAFATVAVTAAIYGLTALVLIILKTDRDCALPAHLSLQDRFQAPQARHLRMPWHRDGSPWR